MLPPYAAKSLSPLRETNRRCRLYGKLLATRIVGLACIALALGIQPPAALLAPLADSSEHRMELDANERLVASVRSTRRTKCKTVPTAKLPPSASVADSSTIAHRLLAHGERYLPNAGDRIAPLRC